MPEMPEVENVRATLQNLVPGKKINQVIVHVPKMIKNTPPDEFVHMLVGQEIEGVRRRGKFLLFDLTNCTILSHLRMEGKFRLMNETDEVSKHTHIIFHFEDHTELRFLDVRKFGTMEVTNKFGEADTNSIKKLGPEPLTPAFTLEAFATGVKKTSRAIKTALLDQKLVAGIGNIYADEICFEAKVRPERAANSLSNKEIKLLFEATKSIMTEAVALGGSTVRTYVNSQGELGRYQEKLKVYGKTSEPCVICGTQIEKIKLNGRGTHFCPNCQK
ncbi:DNA-formamidopyrimidine glycosylase [Listeria ivanovii]|uniref:DNA-formamidopyrimidine glycosylase n=1 Tax=Listeria ivanovii TaxID=1638 RepID=UPI000DA78DC9|nr:DNA-formamidopyrimidine glycosylase [Listeria ivanovii]PZG34705.1 DNA-formamidopyrimidine glycosylase [Listeria ivanovii]PZG49999.1 DNA-formamidopyrimidine glycosylase [Listeria ivanovii]PZH12742.1 DNA-formamidopyrimidine glycosylase [Listeria ivanovii]